MNKSILCICLIVLAGTSMSMEEDFEVVSSELSAQDVINTIYDFVRGALTPLSHGDVRRSHGCYYQLENLKDGLFNIIQNLMSGKVDVMSLGVEAMTIVKGAFGLTNYCEVISYGASLTDIFFHPCDMIGRATVHVMNFVDAIQDIISAVNNSGDRWFYIGKACGNIFYILTDNKIDKA